MRVVGTAGHVDHGKSTLVAALTGIDPDRLKEEKAREMTIELGFAWMDLPDGETIGIIDVPGHRDFIENMLAGVGGMDAVIFVIAADEGIMPQTTEHLAILDLLDVKKGIIALTKSDLIRDQDWLELVISDIKNAAKGTFLQDSAIIQVSAKSGYGLKNLLIALQAILSTIPEKVDTGKPRVSIDRVFSIQGFGTVVTGTLIDGKLFVGDDIIVFPSGKKAKIRGLQTHKMKTDSAFPGSRVAINLTGLDIHELKRGDLVTTVTQFLPSLRMDVFVKILPESSVSLKHNDEIKIFHLAAERMARIRLLGRQILSPGESGYVQLEFSEPLAAKNGDRFIICYPSPGETIGGGTIILPNSPKRYKHSSEDAIQKLSALHTGTIQERLLMTVSDLPYFGITELSYSLEMPEEVVSRDVNELIKKSAIIELTPQEIDLKQKIFIAAGQWNKLCNQVETVLSDFHFRYPLRVGIPKEELKSRLQLDNRFFNLILHDLIARERLIEQNGLIHLPQHRVVFSADQLERIEKLNTELNKSPFSPPGNDPIREILGAELFSAVINQNLLIRVSKDVVFRKSEYDSMLSYIYSKINSTGSLTVTEFRDQFNTSRKYALAFLEYLDQSGITIRDGDFRRLRSPNKLPE